MTNTLSIRKMLVSDYERLLSSTLDEQKLLEVINTHQADYYLPTTINYLNSCGDRVRGLVLTNCRDQKALLTALYHLSLNEHQVTAVPSLERLAYRVIAEANWQHIDITRLLLLEIVDVVHCRHLKTNNLLTICIFYMTRWPVVRWLYNQLQASYLFWGWQKIYQDWVNFVWQHQLLQCELLDRFQASNVVELRAD